MLVSNEEMGPKISQQKSAKTFFGHLIILTCIIFYYFFFHYHFRSFFIWFLHFPLIFTVSINSLSEMCAIYPLLLSLLFYPINKASFSLEI